VDWWTVESWHRYFLNYEQSINNMWGCKWLRSNGILKTRKSQSVLSFVRLLLRGIRANFPQICFDVGNKRKNQSFVGKKSYIQHLEFQIKNMMTKE
jgi:hypothetical protein